jgi:hypothetical protein
MTEVTVKKYFDAIFKHDPSLMMDLHRGIYPGFFPTFSILNPMVGSYTFFSVRSYKRFIPQNKGFRRE